MDPGITSFQSIEKGLNRGYVQKTVRLNTDIIKCCYLGVENG
jgi:hypothetical protein